MTDRKHDTHTHHCQVPGESIDLVSDLIEVGLFVDFRRSLKRLLIIHPKHPYTRFYASSIQKLRHEERRHLVDHYYMIHPLSLFNFFFDVFMASLLLGTFIIAPIVTQAFDRTLVQRIFSFKNLMHFVLVIVCFCRGHYDFKNNVVVLAWNKVAMNYLKTYFIIDLAGIIPTIIRFLMHFGVLHDRHLWARLSAPLMVLIMYGRYIYCMDVFAQVKLATGISSYAYKAIKLVLHLVVFILLTTLILYLFLVTELWYNFSSTEEVQTTTFDSMDAFMRYKALPMDMRDRIWLYINFKYQGHFYKESAIKRATSLSLRKEILVETSKSSTKDVDLFQKLPESVLEKLRGNMISEYCLPGDVIIRAGQKGKCMFFILAGTVKVTTREDKIVCYLRDGTHFGEVALVVNIARVANVIAETPCELFKLSRKDFVEVIKGYPLWMQEMEDMAAQRMAGSLTAKAIEAEDKKDVLSEASVESDRRDTLRKYSIVDSGSYLDSFNDDN